MNAAFCILLALLVLFLVGCGVYAERSARRQPEYQFGSSHNERERQTGWS